MKRLTKSTKKSLQYSFSIIAGLNTIAGILGYAIKDIYPSWSWWKWGLILLGLFVILFLIIQKIVCTSKHKPYKTIINGKPVEIKIGDLFSEPGWKVIPFNDRYDIQVDDVIITHSSLNGKMIDTYVSDIDELKTTINNAKNDRSKLKPELSGDKLIYPLGRLIPYKDFLMLSFSHFDDQNQAYIGIGEYEQMLIRMWAEMRRIYASKAIAIPLVGTGITTIVGLPEKNYTEFLKCILCTLRGSKFQPEQGVCIVLTPDAMEQVDMNIIKEEF